MCISANGSSFVEYLLTSECVIDVTPLSCPLPLPHVRGHVKATLALELLHSFIVVSDMPEKTINWPRRACDLTLFFFYLYCEKKFYFLCQYAQRQKKK